MELSSALPDTDYTVSSSYRVVQNSASVNQKCNFSYTTRKRTPYEAPHKSVRYYLTDLTIFCLLPKRK